MNASVLAGRTQQLVLDAGSAVAHVLNATRNIARFEFVGEEAEHCAARQGLHCLKGFHVLANQILHFDDGHCES